MEYMWGWLLLDYMQKKKKDKASSKQSLYSEDRS